MPESTSGLTLVQASVKRIFDLTFSFLGLGLFWWIIATAYVLARIDTGQSGFFTQTRIGRYGKPFTVVKIGTMRPCSDVDTCVTTSKDVRITPLGRFFRRTKIDELPQLFNVLKGDMSFVGPRPDVPGFADKLKGRDRIVLLVGPGITGPATLRYRDEEEILARQANPETYNLEVLWPEKTRLNRKYVESYSFWSDICLILKTVSRK